MTPVPPVPGGGRRTPIVVADIGGTTVKIGAVSKGSIHPASERHDTHRLDPRDPAGTLAGWLKDFARTHALSPESIVVTVPGSLSADFERVLKAANVACLEGRSLRSELAARLDGVSLHLERDVDVLLQGEMAHYGLGDDVTVLGVFIGTGVGASCVWKGQVYRGNGQGMQLGLAPIRGDGQSRPWARRDTLEVYASGRAMQEIAEERGFPILDFFAFVEKDAQTAAWFEGCLRDQILHIATAISLMAPDILVLGGGVLDLAGYPIERLEAGLRGYVSAHETGRDLSILYSRLGWQAALLGSERVVSSRASARPGG